MRMTRWAVVGLFGLLACTRASSIPRLDGKEVQGLLRNDFAILLDVRESAEIRQTGLASAAIWLPFSKIVPSTPEWEALVARLPRDKQIVIYGGEAGETGSPSRLTAELLLKQGFKVGDLERLENWISAGGNLRRL